MDFLLNNVGLMAGVSGAGVVLWILKKVPNAKISLAVEGTCFRLGRVITMFMGSKKSRETLENALSDPDEPVRDSAVVALSNLEFMEKLSKNEKFAKLTGG